MTPIIAFTANAVSTAREMFRQAGFDGFVSKPVDRVELERVMRRVLPTNLVVTEEVSGRKAVFETEAGEPEVKEPEESKPYEPDVFKRLEE